jgi:alkanesulfonate monooxygenase SsuD/methylene tetrahydromethanopterin reductase-like flavin-dependent oxidoreductase (luciferase family)
VRRVDELGFDYAFVTEHHFVEDGVMPSPLTVLAAAAAVTQKIRIGTHILLLPLHQVVRVAEEAAIVDRLSQGRMILGMGAGYREEEFGAFGISRSSRWRRMEEGPTILRTAWSNQLVRTDGYPIGVKVVPQPVIPGELPIWLGGFGPNAVDRAVRLSDAYLMGGAGAVPSEEPYNLYKEALERHAKTQRDVNLVGNRIVHCAATDEQAWEEIRLQILARHNRYAHWFESASDRPGAKPVSTPEDLPRENYIVGSPETCVTQIMRYRERYGVDVMLFSANEVPGPLSSSLPTLELFSNEVLPYVR